MRTTLSILCALFIGSLSLQAQTLTELPSDPGGDKCYVRCVTPDVYETQTERIMVTPAYKRLTVVPATYKEVTERVLVKEGYKRYEFVPATFTTESVSFQSKAPADALSVREATFTDDAERIMIKPEVSRWETTAYEGCESDNPLDCQVLCYRTYEAQYRSVPVRRLASDANTSSSRISGEDDTYEKQVVATPAEVRTIEVDPVYENITKRVVDTPASVEETTVDAVFEEITKEVLVTKGGISTYEEIECELLSYNVLPINYANNSAALNAEARRVIDDNLLVLLQERPNIRIQINSHTSSVGSVASNQDLSERRASGVASYLISKGINSSRLVTRGYGESQLTNRCADGVNCSEAEHAVNRRTEFRVLNTDL